LFSINSDNDYGDIPDLVAGDDSDEEEEEER